MSASMDTIAAIVEEARKHLYEQPWIEFKRNNDNAQEIGEYISALSNTAALFNQERAYMIWGIDDSTHEVVGDIVHATGGRRVGNQGLEYGLAHSWSRRSSFISIDEITACQWFCWR